jgi:uncharacterized protein (DUF983 family)
MNEKNMFGKGVWGKAMNLNAEIVNGICPTCSQDSILVSICAHNYRCTTCGHDMEQKVNGVITYIPITSALGGPQVSLSRGTEKA